MKVNLKDGVPTAIVWKNQTHQVVELARQWRVDIGWWRQRTWRHYFKVSTDTGMLVEFYQDLEAKAWYLQRLYD